MKEINITDLYGQVHTIDLDNLGNQAFCMDCMELMKALPDKVFHLAICDPPYGGVTKGGYMSNQMGGGVALNRNDYNLGLWDQPKPSAEYFKELRRVSVNQIIWGGNYFQTLIQEDSQCWIVWDKVKPEGVSFADCEMAWTSFNLASRLYTYAWNGMIQGNMKQKEFKIHPTQKPIELYAWTLSKYAKKGDRILDTHLGSQSSRIAAWQAGYDFLGCEIDKDYYEQGCKRYESYACQYKLF